MLFFLLLAFAIVSDFAFAQTNPQAYKLSGSPYYFNEWSENSPAKTYPVSMIFHTLKKSDPKLEDEMTGDWTSPYNLKSKARFNGLGQYGFSFLSTSLSQDDEGYPGAAVLALDTRYCSEIYLRWTARTFNVGERNYFIQLQYRIGDKSKFTNVPNSVYSSSQTKGDFQVFGPIKLPDDCANKSYIQLRWKYCYANDGSSGTRPQLAVDDIYVADNLNSSINEFSDNFEFQIIDKTLFLYPNEISSLEIYNSFGQIVYSSSVISDCSIIYLNFLSNGLYFIVLNKQERVVSKELLLY